MSDRIEAGELVEPVEIPPEAVEAAKEEIDLERVFKRRDTLIRTGKTFFQGLVAAAVSAALLEALGAFQDGSTNYKAIALLAGNAALSAAVAYVQNALRRS